LRAAVLGANDGIVSTSSLIIGVASSQAEITAVLVSGSAGLVAGAMSMAAGEYVSVCSQVDTEQADLNRERQELAENHHQELNELKAIYISRGLKPGLAQQVAEQLMAHDALAAHTRDELGITETTKARPLQAALASALTFFVGAMLPLLVVLAFAYWPIATMYPINANLAGMPISSLVLAVAGISLLAMILLGVASAITGGSSVFKAVARVTFWGLLSMLATASLGLLFGAVGG
jgi:VIT1/CCC1 family predicted Fe2+/Mn2+ transporter